MLTLLQGPHLWIPYKLQFPHFSHSQSGRWRDFWNLFSLVALTIQTINGLQLQIFSHISLFTYTRFGAVSLMIPLCLLISWILHYLGINRTSQVFAGLIPSSRAETPRLLLEDARFCLCEQHWLLANKLVSPIRCTRIYLKREHEHKVWGAMLL